MEDILDDFDRYGIDFKESNTRFPDYANSTNNRLTVVVVVVCSTSRSSSLYVYTNTRIRM